MIRKEFAWYVLRVQMINGRYLPGACTFAPGLWRQPDQRQGDVANRQTHEAEDLGLADLLKEEEAKDGIEKPVVIYARFPYLVGVSPYRKSII